MTERNCIPMGEGEVIRLDREGFHYRGQFIADAGEAHRLFVERLRKFQKNADARRWPEATDELRARVETLETMREAVLDLYEQHDKLKEWVGKNYLRIRALEPISEEENDRRFQACMKLIHEATPEQIRDAGAQARSLVSRVALAISQCEDSAAWDDEALNWAPGARAAIREVARWLRCSTDISHGPKAADWLEQEAKQ
jgi:hypothetical protein